MADLQRPIDLNFNKSEGDKKEYRIVILSSNLEVLLVSSKANGDENIKAAAAMSIQAGTFADPAVAEGCAHFLEHMVFMGSEKYPDENYYDSFVQSHGGGCNAFTEGEYTTYQFDINSASFKQALDIFANCFISPLLTKSSMDREVNAINSEFNLAKTSDGNRLQQLFAHEVTDGHVLRKFSWGNEHSLKTVPAENNVDMHKMLRSFHAKHYVPQNMKLVVVGPFTLDELESDVRNSFGNWEVTPEEVVSAGFTSETVTPSAAEGNKRKKKKLDKSSSAGIVLAENTAGLYILPSLGDVLAPLTNVPVFQPNTLNTLTRVVPIKHTHRLLLQFPLPPTSIQYRTKPIGYIGHLLGHEGPNSLLSLLKVKFNYATSLSSGVSSSNMEENSMFSLFEISVSLTDLGLANWPEVVSLVHQYIAMMRNAGPQEWVHEEIRQLAEIYYRYLDEEEASDLAERLSVEMLPYHQRAREDLLSATYLHYEYDPQGIQEILEKYLTVRSAKVCISSPVYGSKQEEDSDEEGDDDSGSGSEEDSGEEDGESGDDESGSEEGDSDEEGEEGGAEMAEKTVLTVEQLTEMYTGNKKWLSLILPPDQSDVLEEPFFGTKYFNDTLPKDLVKYWEKAKIHEGLGLPPRNKFIPQNLNMVSGNAEITANTTVVSVENVHIAVENDSQTSSQTTSQTAAQTVQFPVQLSVGSDLDGVVLWHLLDEQFQSPKAEVYCKVYSPVIIQSVKNIVCHDLFCIVMRDVLNETLYMASMADLNAEISTTDNALSLKVSGYSDKALLLMNTLLSGVFSDVHAVTADGFSRNVEQLRKVFRNTNMSAQRAASDARLSVLMPFRPSVDSKLEALEAVTLDSFKAYASAFVSAIRVEWMVQGNVTATHSTELVTYLSTTIADKNMSAILSKNINNTGGSGSGGCTPITLSADNISPYVITTLAPNTLYLLHTIPRNPLENNIAVEMYYQLGPYSVESLTCLDLLEQLISEPYFDDLRTKQQLGYSVSCGVRQTHGSLGFCFQVVSSAFSLSHVQNAMITFIDQIASHTVRFMSEEQYRNNVTTVVNHRTERDLSLSEAAGKNWGEIDDHRFEFDIRAKQVQLLTAWEGTKQENMVTFSENLLMKNPKLLIVHSSLSGVETSEMDVSQFATFKDCVVKRGKDAKELLA